MKKIKLILFLMLAAALFGCKNSAGNNDDNTANQNNFEAGWYKYTISASGTTKQYYLCYDANKVLTRVGSEESEYTGTVFETYKNNEGFSYDTLSKSQDSYATFKKISDSELPEWAKKSSQESQDNFTPNPEKLLELSNFLSAFYKGTCTYETITEPERDKIEFLNISNVISKDEFDNSYITCTVKCTNNSDYVKEDIYNNQNLTNKTIRIYYCYNFEHQFRTNFDNIALYSDTSYYPYEISIINDTTLNVIWWYAGNQGRSIYYIKD